MSDIDILQTCVLVPRVDAELHARYRVHRITPETEKEVLARVGGDIRALVTAGGEGASAALIDALPKLEIITAASVGYETIDIAHAARRGIPVTNTPDVLTDDCADIAIALLLMTVRRFAEAERFTRAGRWDTERFPLATAIRGKKLGILGLGRIGNAIAHRAECFGLSIAYTNRKPAANAPYRFIADPVELARDSDILMVAASAGPQSRNLVNRAVLDALGPRGYLVNISRGMVVDQPELIAALRENRIAGAGLDVYADEPHVPAELRALDNAVLLPHIASATHETRDAMGQLVLDNLAAHFAGKTLVTPVPA